MSSNELADANRQIARLQSGEIIESDLLTAVDMLALAEARIRELEAELDERRERDEDVNARAAAKWLGGMGE